MKHTIIGEALPNLPWEDRPEGCLDVLWRYSGNPILNWNPIPKAARIYNSAVLPHKSEFVGVFRADQKTGGRRFFRQKQGRPPMENRPRPDPVGG